jgi:hypothetical protein
MTLPGRIVATCASVTRRGAGAGDRRGGDDDVLPGDMPGDQLPLRRAIFLAGLARIAAGAFALDPRHALDEDRLGAQRLDLFPRGRADIGGRHLRAQPPRGRDRLKPRDAHPHHEDARAGIVPAAVIIIGRARP